MINTIYAIPMANNQSKLEHINQPMLISQVNATAPAQTKPVKARTVRNNNFKTLSP